MPLGFVNNNRQIHENVKTADLLLWRVGKQAIATLGFITVRAVGHDSIGKRDEPAMSSAGVYAAGMYVVALRAVSERFPRSDALLGVGLPSLCDGKAERITKVVKVAVIFGFNP